tara:strand:- start:2167 stop:3108 length:942 start_codon:yes stop_codon:yes gene_type:complete
MKKSLVIIAARGIGDLIYHLPLLRSLYENNKEKLIIISNKVNHSKEVYKYETFYKKIIYFDNTRFSLFKTLKTIINLKNLINQFNVDELILTGSPRRLMIPVYMSNAKEKIIFGGGKFLFNKDNKYQHLTHSEKIVKYTESLNIKIKKDDFCLKTYPIKTNDENIEIKKIFVSLDSHHDQNNWNINNYIKLIKKILLNKVKIFINFSPTKQYFKDLLPEEIKNSEKIIFTDNKPISEIIEIINSCNFILGNESGPVCLGASLKKEVHSIYIPIHTEPESKIINDGTFYYNAQKETEEEIINKIFNRIFKEKKF